MLAQAAFGQTPSRYNTAWGYRKSITINHAQVSGSVANFPVLFSRTDSDFKSVANGGKVGRTDGGDILFTSSDGVTKLNHEMEQYNAVTGAVTAWVQAPTLSPTTDTVLYVYYGYSSADNQQNAAGAWDSNYKGVWHFGNGSTLSAADSTASAINGTITGATAVAGQISGAAGFNGSGQYIALSAGTASISGSFTVEVWASPADYSTRSIAGSRSPSDASLDFKFMNGTTLHGDIGNGANWLTVAADAALTYNPNSWYRVAYVVTTSGYTIYANGAQVGSGSLSGTPLLLDSSHTVRIGQNGYSSQPEWFKGSIDEVRISNVARSAAWILTGYNNQSSPSAFYTAGSQESAPSGTVPFTVSSVPTGRTLTVDGANCTAPCTFSWLPSSSHTIAVSTTPQAGTTGVQYAYANWSDGGAQSHTVTVPGTPATYTANFTTQYFLNTSVSPVGSGSIVPASSWVSSGTSVAVSAFAGSGYQFTGFTGALSGMGSP